MEEVIISNKFPSKEELEHFNNCDGCGICDFLMSIFSQCSCCSIVIKQEELYWDHPAGDYYCEDCVGSMPDNNTNDFVLCGNRFKRDARYNMKKYHKNFDTTWTCDKCVDKSMVLSRFEILDI